MQNPDSSPRLPFVPGELLFHVEGGTRSIGTWEAIAVMVDARGGTLAFPPSLEEKSRSLESEEQQYAASVRQDAYDGEEEQPPVLLHATFPAEGEAIDPTAEFERLLALAEELRPLGASAAVQPNWLIGAANPTPGGGSGAGPGARPIPIERQPLPLDEALLGPLRAAATEGRAPVRLVILDAWNGDPDESQRLLDYGALLYAVNKWCWDHGAASGYIAPRNGRRAHQEDDPFPMPDHGPFAAHLAASVIGDGRLWLHETVRGRVDETLDLPDKGYITIEGWRVLDEYGMGDSAQLIRALDEMAASIQPGERVVVNLSLIVTIPDIPTVRPPGYWRAEWGPEAPEPLIARLPRNAPPESERLDLALYRAVQRLREKGALIVAAAGNASRGPNERYAASYPAAYGEVLSVTAAAYDGAGEAWYANLAGPDGVALFAGEVTPDEELDPAFPLIGPFTDSAVPILGEPDPHNHSGAVAWAGTSFAAPQASGLAALLWAANPTMGTDEIAARLRGLASDTLPHLSGNGTPYIPLLQY